MRSDFSGALSLSRFSFVYTDHNDRTDRIIGKLQRPKEVGTTGKVRKTEKAGKIEMTVSTAPPI
jgi:hypothetical protein